MEELLREAFKLGQQWVKDIDNEKEPESFTEWFNKRKEAINYTRCCEELPTSTQLLSDCKKRFKELEGKGNFDYRSYMNGYLDSFSKNVVSKIK